MSDKIRVLLVDDDPDFIEANSIILEASGFEVLTASSGAEGLKKVEEEKPDLVVLDVMMENTDEGFSVARKIRKKLHSDVPIIMLTSVSQATGYTFKPEEHPDFFPVDQFLEKPVPPTTLVKKIREALEKGE
ncbi:MAG TPA: response regulator [Candidatus Sabulitectum sp.]|nr:response regulator [Candidatus Sabulitectum sp.]HPF31672.1 response regulator [Candidatus Sabulitectum sp.]HPJ28266.1 response regulator [Candidatus Sabulitectum sp.]HPR22388.1 response regulator [Candidatus Sabulitectum sp.]